MANNLQSNFNLSHEAEQNLLSGLFYTDLTTPKGHSIRLIGIGQNYEILPESLDELLETEDFADVKRILETSPSPITIIVDAATSVQSIKQLLNPNLSSKERLVSYWSFFRKLQPIFGVCYASSKIIYIFPRKKAIEQEFRHEFTHLAHTKEWFKKLGIVNILREAAPELLTLIIATPLLFKTLMKIIDEVASNDDLNRALKLLTGLLALISLRYQLPNLYKQLPQEKAAIVNENSSPDIIIFKLVD